MQYPTRAVNWILKGGCQGVYTWRLFKAKINMWRLKKDRDSWIYDLVWGVTCPLKYKLLVNFFVHLVKSSRFSRNVLYEARDLKFCLSYTWHVNFSKNSCMKSCQDHESHSESSLMDALCSDIHCFFTQNRGKSIISNQSGDVHRRDVDQFLCVEDKFDGHQFNEIKITIYMSGCKYLCRYF